MRSLSAAHINILQPTGMPVHGQGPLLVTSEDYCPARWGFPFRFLLCAEGVDCFSLLAVLLLSEVDAVDGFCLLFCCTTGTHVQRMVRLASGLCVAYVGHSTMQHICKTTSVVGFRAFIPTS